MRKRLLVILLALTLLLTGCAVKSAETEKSELQVYRLDSGGALVTESVSIGKGESALLTLSRALNTEAQREDLKKVFPAGVWIEDCVLAANRARVSMSKGYRELSGLEKTLTDRTIACTLLRLDAVLAVDILQDGQLFAQGLTAEDVVLSDAQSEGCERIVKLFLPDFEEPGLVAETALVTMDGTAEIWELAARELLERLDCLPEGTALRAISCAEGVCTLTLSQELYTTEPVLVYSARLVIGSFVNTLCYLGEVDQVILRVGGTPLASYGSYIPAWPMSYDGNLLK